MAVIWRHFRERGGERKTMESKNGGLRLRGSWRSCNELLMGIYWVFLHGFVGDVSVFDDDDDDEINHVTIMVMIMALMITMNIDIPAIAIFILLTIDRLIGRCITSYNTTCIVRILMKSDCTVNASHIRFPDALWVLS